MADHPMSGYVRALDAAALVALRTERLARLRAYIRHPDAVDGTWAYLYLPGEKGASDWNGTFRSFRGTIVEPDGWVVATTLGTSPPVFHQLEAVKRFAVVLREFSDDGDPFGAGLQWADTTEELLTMLVEVNRWWEGLEAWAAFDLDEGLAMNWAYTAHLLPPTSMVAGPDAVAEPEDGDAPAQ